MTINVTSIQYKRTHNMGNFNSETVTIFADITEDEDPIIATQNLKIMAEEALDLNQEQKASKVQSVPSVNDNKAQPPF